MKDNNKISRQVDEVKLIEYAYSIRPKWVSPFFYFFKKLDVRLSLRNWELLACSKESNLIKIRNIVNFVVSSRPIERPAVDIINRKTIATPLLTGTKLIDSLIPIGRGQRELIIGDRQTGKSTIALDAIINQRYKGEVDLFNINSVYVLIGQKLNNAFVFYKLLKSKGCENFVVLTAASGSPAVLQYIAPYSGCTIGEYYRDLGSHSLIIYDDLSKHAMAYRQLSLLLRRPPGREAYPGDVFFIHSRLLERAANTRFFGSLTAFPIIETFTGDVSAYIATNVISITDGQIFLDADLFFRGIHPSVNIGLSVSRVGSAAQHKITKQITGRLKLQLAQFREVEIFARVGAVDKSTILILERGDRLIKVLEQTKNNPYRLAQACLILYAGINDFFMNTQLSRVKKVEVLMLFKPIKGLRAIFAVIDFIFLGYQLYNKDWVSKKRCLFSAYLLLKYFYIVKYKFIKLYMTIRQASTYACIMASLDWEETRYYVLLRNITTKSRFNYAKDNLLSFFLLTHSHIRDSNNNNSVHYYRYTNFLRLLPRVLNYRVAFTFITDNLPTIINEANKYMISRYIAILLRV